MCVPSTWDAISWIIFAHQFAHTLYSWLNQKRGCTMAACETVITSAITKIRTEWYTTANCTVEMDKWSKWPTGALIHSPTFDLCGYQWRLNLRLDNDIKYLHVFVESQSDFVGPLRVAVTLHSKKSSIEHIMHRLKNSKGDKEVLLDFPYFASLATITEVTKGYVENDALTFSVEVTTYEFSKSKPMLSTDMRALLFAEDTLGRDVIFCFPHSRDNLRAHTAILGARSPMFQAMFISETFTGEIAVTDTEANVMKELLTYIYTDSFSEDRLTNDIELVRKLFAAAHTYDVYCVRAECEAAMCNRLSADNVCEVLSLAEAYAANELKIRCIDFALSKCPQIFFNIEFVEKVVTGAPVTEPPIPVMQEPSKPVVVGQYLDRPLIS
jgi:hypothetical protein